MSIEAALDKVRKLLRLATSANPHEAALAAARAQDLIERHKIAQFTLDYEEPAKAAPEEPIRNFDFDPLDHDSPTWKRRLTAAIARVNQCKPFISGGQIALIGRPSDVSTVRYMYAWLSREIDRLAKEHCAGCGRTYFNNFRVGAVETLSKRLREQHQQTVQAVKHEAVSAHALMVVEKALANQEQRGIQVDEWAKANMTLRKLPRSQMRLDGGAREAGRRAGESINLAPAAGALGSSRKALR